MYANEGEDEADERETENLQRIRADVAELIPDLFGHQRREQRAIRYGANEGEARGAE
jgi:hypothetical protein